MRRQKDAFGAAHKSKISPTPHKRLLYFGRFLPFLPVKCALINILRPAREREREKLMRFFSPHLNEMDFAV